jgi:hypothetical protein
VSQVRNNTHGRGAPQVRNNKRLCAQVRESRGHPAAAAAAAAAAATSATAATLLPAAATTATTVAANDPATVADGFLGLGLAILGAPATPAPPSAAPAHIPGRRVRARLGDRERQAAEGLQGTALDRRPGCPRPGRSQEEHHHGRAHFAVATSMRGPKAVSDSIFSGTRETRFIN